MSHDECCTAIAATRRDLTRRSDISSHTRQHYPKSEAGVEDPLSAHGYGTGVFRLSAGVEGNGIWDIYLPGS